MDLEERIRRGEEAKRLLEHKLMKEASDHIEAECWRLFKALPSEDASGLAEVKRMQYTHTKYMAFLKSAVLDGEQAKMDAEWSKKRRGLGDVVTAIRQWRK